MLKTIPLHSDYSLKTHTLHSKQPRQHHSANLSSRSRQLSHVSRSLAAHVVAQGNVAQELAVQDGVGGARVLQCRLARMLRKELVDPRPHLRRRHRCFLATWRAGG